MVSKAKAEKQKKAAGGGLEQNLKLYMGGIAGVVLLLAVGAYFLGDPNKGAGAGAGLAAPGKAGPKFTHAELISASRLESLVAEKHAGVLVDFYTPDCPHCKVLAPEFDAAAEITKENNGAPLASIDCSIEAEVCKKFEITRYPTMKWFRNGEPVLDYPPRDRVAKKIAEWTAWAAQPAIHDIGTSEEYKESLGSLRDGMSEKAPPLFVAFDPTDPSQNTRKVLEACGERVRGKSLFLYVNGQDPDGASIKALAKEESGDKTYTGEMNREEVMKWIRQFVPKDKWAE